ncbi:hypothetical protein [Nocardia aurantiaca]|uniref:Uncharacterized protein n=1 Tax=Nocardia aurantiaca TaxID=2675850 RepID=A0A6I3L431_9NOCA|nr:hypothetical protein [Nocardia aurantiaca]MTE15246.1 hypothetical protein [Nocardia aurantiaca]
MTEIRPIGEQLRRRLGDRRFLLALPRALGLRNPHPVIAVGSVRRVPIRLWEYEKRTVSRMIYMAHSDRDMRPVIRMRTSL